VHLELALIGLDELLEGLPVPGLRAVDQIYGHDRIPASLLPLAPADPLTHMDTGRIPNRALSGRSVRRTAGVYLIERR
jgi:hypothetical protein